ncbi:MAG: Na+/H+ antiporter subunit E [Rhodobacterales bacterium]
MDSLRLKAAVHRVLILGSIWVVLSGPQTTALVLGAIAVPAAVWLSLSLIPARNPLHLWRVLRHIPAFIAGSVSGGVDVALRALSPRMRLRPGWIAVPVALRDGGRAALGSELSLMPGTLSAGTSNGKLLVHLLDTQAGFEKGIPRTEAAIAAMIADQTAAEDAP